MVRKQTMGRILQGVMLVVLLTTLMGCSFSIDWTGFGQETVYTVYTADELRSIANTITDNYTYGDEKKLNAHIKLGADIYLETPAFGDTDGNWIPIGNTSNPFTGTFDGDGYTITNLNIYRPNEDYVGLFGCVDDATIIDLGLVSVDVAGQNFVGSIVGYVYNTTITNSYASGTVSGEDEVGGLVGSAYTTTLENTYASGTVTGTYDVGGLLGNGYDCKLKNSSAAVTVSGTNSVGGLIGDAGASIESCHAVGDVTGDSSIGGLVGNISDNTIESSYASGDVTGDSSIGGLVGYGFSNTIESSYASGDVTGDYYIGGLVGYINGDSSLNNSVAANVTIMRNAGDSSSNLNRVAGYVNNYPPYNIVELADNYANSGMTVLGALRTSTDATGLDGAGKSLPDLKSPTFYSTAGNWSDTATWKSSGSSRVWRFIEGRLPHLAWEYN